MVLIAGCFAYSRLMIVVFVIADLLVVMRSLWLFMVVCGLLNLDWFAGCVRDGCVFLLYLFVEISVGWVFGCWFGLFI